MFFCDNANKKIPAASLFQLIYFRIVCLVNKQSIRYFVKHLHSRFSAISPKIARKRKAKNTKNAPCTSSIPIGSDPLRCSHPCTLGQCIIFHLSTKPFSSSLIILKNLCVISNKIVLQSSSNFLMTSSIPLNFLIRTSVQVRYKVTQSYEICLFSHF